jgi:hypothetical protein
MNINFELDMDGMKKRGVVACFQPSFKILAHCLFSLSQHVP